ncbi:hypothetical protein D3C71_1598440 [compost metagenome]
MRDARMSEDDPEIVELVVGQPTGLFLLDALRSHGGHRSSVMPDNYKTRCFQQTIQPSIDGVSFQWLHSHRPRDIPVLSLLLGSS